MADNLTAQEYAMERAREKRSMDYLNMFKENEGYKTRFTRTPRVIARLVLGSTLRTLVTNGF